jgi:hypothetical protein
MLNMIMLAADALPVSGTITVMQPGAAVLAVQIAGLRAAWPADLAACLADPAGLETSLATRRRPQAALTVLLARAAGGRLSCEPQACGPGLLRFTTNNPAPVT